MEDIIGSRSSYLKASNFTANFVQPPFFAEDDDSRSFQYHPDKSGDFLIFLADGASRGAWRKYTPRSDWMVTSRTFVIQVISQKSETDRHRMLLQAIAVARAGCHLLKSTSEKRFFVVAIYMDEDMVASRYIVMQINPGNEELKPVTVSIHQEDFDLANTERQLYFLREMYNLATQITQLSDDLNQSKRDKLNVLKIDAKKVLSLTLAHGKTKTIDTTKTDTDEEGHDEKGRSQDKDDLGHFEAEDIQNVLQQMNYKIQFVFGVVRTEDYMAPEVRKGRTKLLEIAGQLTNQDPEAQPKMSGGLGTYFNSK